MKKPFYLPRLFLVSLVALPGASRSQGAARPPFQLESSVPITYIRDYRPGLFDSGDFLKSIASDTPDLLVLGKNAPIHHNWGPVAGDGGENQAFGKGAYIRRLPPDELRKKMEKIEKMTARLHALGVTWIMPYLCTITIGGDPDKRTGFWDFYDHWDDYAGFGLGPRPKEDPLDWMERTSDGKIKFYYPRDQEAYAPNFRCAACIQHPGWRRHLENIVRLAAEVGYDGVYMDNNRSNRCYCDHCQRAFRRYLAARLTPEELKRDLGVERIEDLRLSPEADPFVLDAVYAGASPREYPRLGPGAELYRVKLTWEFWTDSKIDLLRELKAIGARARGGDFHIFANTTAWTKGASDIARVSAVASFNQSEENGGRTGAHPGLVPTEISGAGAPRIYNRRAFEYKFNQSICSGMRMGMLSRAGGERLSREHDILEENPQTAALAIAESATYGGGGGFKMQLEWDAHHEIRRWREFFQARADLYQGADVWAPIGVIAFAEQFYCGGQKTHQEALKQLGSDLLQETVLFDLIHEVNFSLDRLRRYQAIIVPPGVRSLSGAQLEIFRRYAQEGGGTLVVMGDDFASLDEKCRSRPAADREIAGALRLPATASADEVLARLSPRPVASPASVADRGGRTPAGIGANAYFKSSAAGAGEILLHLVNYNVPLGKDRNDPPLAVADLMATVLLPPHWQVEGVKAFSPYPDEDLRITFEQEGDAVRLRIPRLHLYKVIRISGRNAPGSPADPGGRSKRLTSSAGRPARP